MALATLRAIPRARTPFLATSHGSRRAYAATFAELYRKSVDNAIVQPGDTFSGHVVGRQRPRSSSSRFYIVDFGMKSEAPFAAKEIPGASAIGDEVSMPLVELEDDFNEPVFDFERRTDLPKLQAERYELLIKTARNDVRILHGRFVGFKRGGANVKVLGANAFAPRHHVVAIDRPVLGSFAPFYLMSMTAEKRPTSASPGLDVNPVVSSYGGFLFCTANLIGIDEAWQKSGGGSGKQRLGYLRLLTRLLLLKNVAVRRILPRNVDGAARTRSKKGAQKLPAEDQQAGDAAWLHDLPKRDWASSSGAEQGENAEAWDHLRRPVALRPQRKRK